MASNAVAVLGGDAGGVAGVHVDDGRARLRRPGDLVADLVGGQGQVRLFVPRQLAAHRGDRDDDRLHASRLSASFGRENRSG